MQMIQVNDGFYKNEEDTVRIERAPHKIDMIASQENLDDKVTHPKYFAGAKDMLGNTIEIGKPMKIIDWGHRQLPPIWRVYEMDPELGRFIQIFTSEDLNEALASVEGEV